MKKKINSEAISYDTIQNEPSAVGTYSIKNNSDSDVTARKNHSKMKWFLMLPFLFIVVYMVLNFMEEKQNSSFSNIPDTNAIDQRSDKTISNEVKENTKTEPIQNNVNPKQSSELTETGNKQQSHQEQQNEERPAILPNVEQIKNVTEVIETPNNKTNVKTVTVHVPSQNIDISFNEDLTSNDAAKGSIVFLSNMTEVKSSNTIVIKKGAAVKALVKEAKPSINGGVGHLAIEMIAVHNVNDEWIPLRYPEYSKKDRKVVVFKKDQLITKVRLNSFTTKI